MNSFLFILLIISMAISVVEDIRRMKIPNWLTYSTMLFAIAYHTMVQGGDGFILSGGGLALGIGLFFVPYMMGGLGAGDAKLMGAAGAIMGPKAICIASVMVILAGGVYGVILFFLNPRACLAFLKRLWTSIKIFIFTAKLTIIPPNREEKQPVLRYAIPIAIGTLSYATLECIGYDLSSYLFGLHFNIFDV